MTVTTYVVYLVVAVALTVWVARTLSHNGRLFLLEVFGGKEDVADAVNKLLVVGFYLVNLGFVTLFLRGKPAVDVQEMFERLSVKLGVVLLVLGVLHLMNLYLFTAIRKRSRETRPPMQPPTQPPMWPSVTADR